MKKLQFFSIFLVVALLAGLLSTTAIAAPEESDTFENLTISAKAALLVDGSTGQVLLQQDAHEQLYPASLTKCMTTLLVLQAVDEGTLSLDQTITASQTAINMLTDDSSSAGIQAGEQLTVEQLLYCVMVQSANEACYILAEAVSGSVDAFVEEMNAEAERLGCKDTHFVNPCGLHDPEHYTSAWDMYLIVKEAMNYSMFMTLANTKTYTLPATNLSEERTFHTTNGLIDRWRYTEYIYPYAQGIKTGHTSNAGYCLVSYAEQGSRSLIGVVLGAQAVTENGSTTIQSFSEMRRMFEWGFSSFTSTTILDHASLIEEIPVTLSRQTNYVSLHPSEDVTVLLPSNVAAEDLVQEVTLDSESVEAPVTAGQKLGTITVSDSSGNVYTTTDLVAANDVSASQVLTLLHRIQVLFANPLVKILAVVIAVAVIFLIVSYLRRRPRRYRGGQSYRTRRRNRRYHGRRRW